MTKTTYLFAAWLAMAGLSPVASAEPMEGRAAFEKLKALAGTWSGPIGAKDGPPGTIVYEVVSGGTAVMEVLFPGAAHEMRSMYHLDKGDLVMTHYCSAGNQPRMRLSGTASTPSRLVFNFDGGTNLDVTRDVHVHEGEIRFLDDGRIEASWMTWASGKPAGANEFFALTREK